MNATAPTGTASEEVGKRASSLALWTAIAMVAYAGVAVTGVQTARQAADMRGLFQRLSDNRKVEDRHLREYRLLLLEKATFAGAQNVEPVATERLRMRFPATVVTLWR